MPLPSPSTPPLPQSPPTASGSLLQPGRNCWRIEHAERLAFLIDGQDYFAAVRTALAAARHSICILGWDIDSRMRLMPQGAGDGLPEPLAEFLDALVARRRGLKAHVLSWDFAMLFALEREWLTSYKLDWLTHRRLHFRLDDRHPFGASHHQKVVVIDDRVAFVSGLDLTRCRWDTPAHRAEEPLRCDPDGAPYGPFHDVGVMVEGDVARGLGDLARERWRRATGVSLRPPPRHAGGLHPAWSPRVVEDLHDVQVAIARTEPAYDGFEAVTEVRELHMDAIASARRHLYLENQYFSSACVGQALARSLQQPDGPEVLVVTPQRESGWLEASTMGVLRSRLHQRLQAADGHGRYRAYCPSIAELGPRCLNLHSKVMTVDDELLTVGSANLSNRSMGFDTECNLVVDAGTQADAAAAARVREAVAALRNRLLGEHLDAAPAQVQAQTLAHGSLLQAVEALRQRTPEPGRTLAPAEPLVSPELDALLPDGELIDPERPLAPERFVAEFVPPEVKPRVSRKVAGTAAAALALAAFGSAWALTPLRQHLDLATFVAVATHLREQPLTPVLALLAYVLGGLVSLPVTLLIAATGIVFGPWLGTLYAVAGSLLSASLTYGAGRLLGRDLVRRFAGPRINRLSRQFARRGVLAMTLVRLLPVAPFTLVNLVAGSSQLSLRDFLLGTLLGMAPGIALTMLFVDSVADAVSRPSFGNLAALALVAALVVIGSAWLRRHFAQRAAPA